MLKRRGRTTSSDRKESNPSILAAESVFKREMGELE